MKCLRFSLIISLLTHVLLLTLLSTIQRNREQSHGPIHLTLTPKTPDLKIPSSLKRTESPLSLSKPYEEQIPEPGGSKPTTEPTQVDPNLLLKTPSWKTFLEKAKKKQTLLTTKPKSLPKDFILQDRFQTWIQTLTYQNIFYRDDISEYIKKQTQGTSSFFLSPRIITKQTDKKIPPKFDFIPTETQLHTLTHLYKKGKATQVDIYPNLETSKPMTAEGLNRSLDFLVKKGFLTKKKISPQNIFTIQTPIGVFPIEMSRKNLLNPVYLYEPRVDRTQLMAYLQAIRFLLQEKLRSAPADSSTLVPQIQNLQEKILILIR